MVVRARAHDTETACRLIGRNPDCAPGAGAVTETGIDSASANRTTAKTVTAAKASGIPPSPRRPKAIGGATAIASDEARSPTWVRLPPRATTWKGRSVLREIDARWMTPDIA